MINPYIKKVCPSCRGRKSRQLISFELEIQQPHQHIDVMTCPLCIDIQVMRWIDDPIKKGRVLRAEKVR